MLLLHRGAAVPRHRICAGQQVVQHHLQMKQHCMCSQRVLLGMVQALLISQLHLAAATIVAWLHAPPGCGSLAVPKGVRMDGCSAQPLPQCAWCTIRIRVPLLLVCQAFCMLSTQHRFASFCPRHDCMLSECILKLCSNAGNSNCSPCASSACACGRMAAATSSQLPRPELSQGWGSEHHAAWRRLPQEHSFTLKSAASACVCSHFNQGQWLS
ncbi:hypothetical protein COO60DRAFT_7100 [Scenedesmus sp. NREL 46B-D3]|nr:hypothetical protein COO60DRAFT_7100 [Scenedesmus sp. NREL 46B-D3]